MLYISKHFKYHQNKNSAILTALDDCIIVFGTDEIRLKEGADGTNHCDLAKSAFIHFFSWPKKTIKQIKKSEKIKIDSFVAYLVIKGKYEISVNESIFFVS
jgi:hypothetical protein